MRNRLLDRALCALVPLACALLPAAAHADDAAPRCTYVDVADLPMRYVSTNLMPAVDAVVNGAPATVLVDTGDFETQLTRNGAARRDLKLHMTGRYVEGFGGDSRLYTVNLKEFSIGPAHNSRQMEVLVIGQDTLSQAFDGIVGAPFLLQTDLQIDLRAKKMSFYRSLNCDKTDLLLWKEPTVIIPFESHFDKSPNPHFTVLVNGKEMDAIIDTGAQSTVITVDAAKRAGVDVKGPDARLIGYGGGIGSEHTTHWAAKFKSVQIGDEAISNAEISIIEPKGDVRTDMFLGEDFLRAHRVLFAMSQKKIYIAYLGGEAFTRSANMPDWMRAEADGGNPDAEYMLATAYNTGRGVKRDPTAAAAWLRKAAAAGQPNAMLTVGHQQLLAGRVVEAVANLRGALDQLPADRIGPLWLYLARVRNGEAALARSELQATIKKQDDDDWPEPIAEFYVGELDDAHLLAQAGKDKQAAHARTCLATSYMAEWYTVQGQNDKGEALRASFHAQCAPPAKPAAAQDGAPAAPAA